MIDKIKPFLLQKQSDITEAEAILKDIQESLAGYKKDVTESLATAESNKDDVEMTEITEELAEITVNHINHDLWLVCFHISRLIETIDKKSQL